MRILTVVMGELYEEMAAITIPLAEKQLGQRVEIIRIPPGSDIFLLKMRLLRDSKEYPLLVIDSDMVFRSWDWSAFDLGKFNAVLDYPLPTWAEGTMRDVGVDAHRAINGGLWLASKEHVPVFERTQELMEGELSSYFLKMGDQTSLNRALQESETEIHYLPTSFNFQVSPRDKLSDVPEDARVIHLVDSARKLERVKKAVQCLIH